MAPQPERRTEPEAAAPEPPPAATTPPERAAARAEAAATAAVASTAVVEPETEPESQPQPDPAAAPPIDLEQLRTLWPTAVETVRTENGMVGALLAEARPIELEGERLTVAFADGAAFYKKKAEANRGLLATALRGLTGHSLELVYELRDGEGAEEADQDLSGLSEEELLERLTQDFGATEVLDHEE